MKGGGQQKVPAAVVARFTELGDVLTPVGHGRATVGEVARRACAQFGRSPAVEPWLARVLAQKRRALEVSGLTGSPVEYHLWSWLDRRIAELEAALYLAPFFEEETDDRHCGVPRAVGRFGSQRISPFIDRLRWEDLVRMPQIAVALYCVERLLLPRIRTRLEATPLAHMSSRVWLEWVQFGGSRRRRGGHRGEALDTAAAFLAREQTFDTESLGVVARLSSVRDASRLTDVDAARCRRLLMRTPPAWRLAEGSPSTVLVALCRMRGALPDAADNVFGEYCVLSRAIGRVDPGLFDEDGGSGGAEAPRRHLEGLADYLPAPRSDEAELLRRLRAAAAAAGGQNAAVFTHGQRPPNAMPSRRAPEKYPCPS